MKVPKHVVEINYIRTS